MFMFSASAATGQIFFAVLIPLPAGPGSPLTWRPTANVYLLSLMLYLAPCPVLLLLQHWQLYTAAVQCGQAQVQVAAMCHGSSPLTCTGQIVERAGGFLWLYQALGSPLLNRLACHWKAPSPQKWGRGSSCGLNSH